MSKQVEWSKYKGPKENEDTHREMKDNVAGFVFVEHFSNSFLLSRCESLIFPAFDILLLPSVVLYLPLSDFYLFTFWFPFLL